MELNDELLMVKKKHDEMRKIDIEKDKEKKMMKLGKKA